MGLFTISTQKILNARRVHFCLATVLSKPLDANNCKRQRHFLSKIWWKKKARVQCPTGKVRDVVPRLSISYGEYISENHTTQIQIGCFCSCTLGCFSLLFTDEMSSNTAPNRISLSCRKGRPLLKSGDM